MSVTEEKYERSCSGNTGGLNIDELCKVLTTNRLIGHVFNAMTMVLCAFQAKTVAYVRMYVLNNIQRRIKLHLTAQASNSTDTYCKAGKLSHYIQWCT